MILVRQIASEFVAMKSWCLISFILLFIGVSVRGACLVINCREGLHRIGERCCTPECVMRSGNKCCDIGTIPSGTRCRRRARRSVDSEGCYGSNKIYFDGELLNTPGPVTRQCGEKQVIDENVQCQPEVWEPNSGPWETHHYVVEGRRVVIEQKRSDYSVRYRYLGIDSNRK